MGFSTSKKKSSKKKVRKNVGPSNGKTVFELVKEKKARYNNVLISPMSRKCAALDGSEKLTDLMVRTKATQWDFTSFTQVKYASQSRNPTSEVTFLVNKTNLLY